MVTRYAGLLSIVRTAHCLARTAACVLSSSSLTGPTAAVNTSFSNSSLPTESMIALGHSPSRTQLQQEVELGSTTSPVVACTADVAVLGDRKGVMPGIVISSGLVWHVDGDVERFWFIARSPQPQPHPVAPLIEEKCSPERHEQSHHEATTTQVSTPLPAGP